MYINIYGQRPLWGPTFSYVQRYILLPYNYIYIYIVYIYCIYIYMYILYITFSCGPSPKSQISLKCAEMS